MSTIKVTNLRGRNGSPTLPDGAVISGVATVTNLKPTNVNVSGAVTATTFDGSLKSTGTPTLGLGVTINSSGVAISGVCTAGIVSATTLYGDGSGLTGVGESIAPWYYNPDVNDVNTGSTASEIGIGITFNKKVEAGSGTATLKIVNAGAAGTTIQSWGVSSCTFNVTEFTLGSLVSNLVINQTYQLDIPSGFIVDTADTDYVGTAYTFTVSPALKQLWTVGANNSGNLGNNTVTQYSSPIQIPGSNWSFANGTSNQGHTGQTVALKDDGTMWVWGNNTYGTFGRNDRTSLSSPTQVPGTTWGTAVTSNESSMIAIKTDGTLWAIGGRNNVGQLGINDKVDRSSPVQIPGTTWWADDTRHTLNGGTMSFDVIKSDGTLWVWGYNNNGQLGQNSTTYYSSPVQIPGTTWRSITGNVNSRLATKTDNTLWAWGYNNDGALGHNNQTNYSSPKQVPGTSWSKHIAMDNKTSFAIRTDGTLWSWGDNGDGLLGQSNPGPSHRSSPIQLPGTTWATISSVSNVAATTKTDGTVWTWGSGDSGRLGQNSTGSLASPVQLGEDTDFTNAIAIPSGGIALMKTDDTP
tara:strand:- start:177 stop:1913 length:1737 start_codon:yes stop_codon:yes gene_type:complete